VNQFNKESYEAHYAEANCGSNSNFLKFYIIAKDNQLWLNVSNLRYVRIYISHYLYDLVLYIF